MGVFLKKGGRGGEEEEEEGGEGGGESQKMSHIYLKEGKMCHKGKITYRYSL